MRKIWNIKDSDPGVRDEIAFSLKISKLTAQLLVNRGASNPAEAREFFTASLSSCHDPSLLKDMDKAVARVRLAISRSEKLLVYGDYDVDGMTSVALVYSALKKLGADVVSYIPSRLEEGYGLNIQAINRVHKLGATLIITVDCGIASFKEIELAGTLGVDTIVTDHHEILGASVPAAFAIINPLQEGCRYPFKHLAGVGLAYKLVKALFQGTSFIAEDYLDLVSLGTVADIAPLIGENRILTKYGLEKLNSRGRVGLNALIGVSGLDGKDISSGHIGFMLGPRINAMGRVGSPQKAVELLLTDDPEEAARLAKMLDSENKNRQKLEARILEEAIAKAEREVNFKHHNVIVLANESWHPGVIGIVASRLVEKYSRPAILISVDGESGKGSGRSVDNFNLFDYLFRCKDILVGFGGHEAACGVTIERRNIEEFRNRINEYASNEIRAGLFDKKLDIDGDIPLNELTEEVIAEMERLAPFGVDNPRPVLVSRNLTVKDGPRRIGKNGFKMWVTDDKVTCEAISFGRGALQMPSPGTGIDLAYMPSMNSWQGLRSIQLELCDIKNSMIEAVNGLNT